MNSKPVAGSFRDPSGFMFLREGVLYRQVNAAYQPHYEKLMESGLYDRLVKRGLLIPHDEVDLSCAETDDAFRVIQPEQIPFITYPYEWSFSQIKDAALATLAIQREILAFGMSLKDASAYNIQFVNGHPVLIDTLSFELYHEGVPWVPYRQFCQHFLAPLALMAHRDIRLGQMLRVYIDGIPLDLASTLLPSRTRVNPGLMVHIHVHARSQQRYAGQDVDVEKMSGSFNERSLIGLLDSLEATVKRLDWQPKGAWTDYYEGDSYDEAGFAHKKELVGEYVSQAAPQTVWDLGANTGVFSRIAAEQGVTTLSWDIDPGAVELNYQEVKKRGEENLLPLVLDLTNPSPAIGWANRERDSFAGRAHPDLVLALALIHHLAIANNVPLIEVAAFFASLAKWLIIEFVPKSDPKVKTLLATREDIFPDYTSDGFEAAFDTHFTRIASGTIENSERTLYLMRRKDA